ncbi:MAG TPA: Ig-like domain-containing protein [Gemmatimonadales bacterium]|nr:Ig-like domain-containing protein [Gemmatimonadales bacterium]
MSTFLRRLSLVSGGLVSLLVLACGGDDLVLPSEGTAASISITRGNNQTGTVGGALADSLQVRVLDKAGRPVPNQPVAWTVVAGGGAVSPASSNTDASGYAGARWTLGSGAGTQQVRAKPTGNGAPDNLQAVFSAAAGASSAASLLKIAGDSQTAVAGSVLPDSLVVRVTDANGNPVADVPVTWSLSGGGAVSSTSLPTGADGRSAVSRTLGATAGKQTTTATASGLDGSPITFTANATVGSAGRLVIARQPSGTAASGAAFGTQPTVQIQDANGNPVALAGIAVQAAMASNPGGGALIGNTTASTNATGLATFSNLGISGPAGNYTIGFSVPNRDDISGTQPSSTIAITAGAATRLRFSVQPSNVATGAAITPAVQVRIEDAQGTLVTGATNNVTIAIGSNPAGATLSGTKTITASGGIATFSNLSLDRPGSGYTLRASASGLGNDESSAFNVATGSATTIAANSPTSLSGTVGSPVSPAPSVKVTDGSGNGVSGVTVTFAVTNGGGSVSGATPTTNSSGIATVGSWTLGTTAGSNALTATASGLSGSPVTFTASAAAGSAGKLSFVTQPGASGTSGQPLSPQPVLQLLDVNDNPVSTGGVTVTASIASGPAGSLSGASVNTASNGRATFSNLEISGPAGTYTLAFSAPSITGVTSNDITIAAGGSTRLGMVTQPSGTAQSGVVFGQQPVVRLEDASGNPVAQPGVIVVASVDGGGPALDGDNSKVTDANGEATFTDLKLTGATGTYSLLFAASGKTSVSSSDIVLGAGPVSASQSEVSASPTSFVEGDASGSAITVTARDQSGNVISGASVAVSADGGSLDATTGTTGASGTATFTFTAAAAGTYSISATINGTAVTTPASVTVTAAPVSGLNSSVTFSATEALAYGGPIGGTVTLEDANRRRLSGRSVTLSRADVFHGGTDPTDGVTGSDGTLSFQYSGINFGPDTVKATSGGVTVFAPISVVTPAVDPSQSRITVDPGGQDARAGTGISIYPEPRTADGTFISGALIEVSIEGTGIDMFGGTTGWSHNAGVDGWSTSFSTDLAQTLVVKMIVNGQDQGIQVTIPVLSTGSPDSVQVVASDSTIATDGQSTVTVIVDDQYGNPIPSFPVTFSVDGGTISPASSSTLATGTASALFTAPALPGTYTVQVGVAGGEHPIEIAVQ